MTVDTDAVPSITNQIATAIKDTLDLHLDEYIGRSQIRDLYYHFQPEVINAALCPALGIYDQGWETTLETIRGRDGAGNLLPGMVENRYSFSLMVFVKGRKREDSLLVVNRLSDAVRACLQNNFQLGGIPVNVVVRAGDPTGAVEEGSSVLRATELRVKIDTWSLQGHTTF